MTAPRLAGRDAELAEIAGILDEAPPDRVLLLVGEPGIGKSALLSEAVSLAQAREALVLLTVGVEAEAQTPFAGLQQLLSGRIAEVEDLAPMHRDALLSSFGLADSERPEVFLIAEAVCALLGSMARSRPVAVVADDLQWLDAQSNDVLAFVARRAHQCGVAMVGAVRTGYKGTFLAAARRVDLSGLNASAADEILAEHAPHLSRSERDRVRREAMGNPLALLELPAIRAGERVTGGGQAHTLSSRLERAFANRISGLPAATRDAALIAAVDYSDELDEILMAAGQLRGARVTVDDLAPAEQVDILRVDGSRLVFRHPLVRSGVLQRETVSRRQAANAALASVVSDAYRRTWHRAQSIVGPDDAIADDLEEVAEHSARRGAVIEAIRSLERSAQLTSLSAVRGHRLLVAAEHAFDLGRADLVDDLLSSARRTDLVDLDRARMAWLREIFNDGTPGDATRVNELCDIAQRSAGAGELDLALNLLLGAALRCWWADTGPSARARVAEVARGLDADDDDRLVAILAVAEPVLEGPYVSAVLAGEPPTDASGLRLWGMAAHAIGDSPRAARLLDAAASELRDHGRLGVLARVLSMLVNIRLDLGDLGGAMAAVNEGLTLAEDTGQPIWSTGTLVCAARAEAMQGHRRRALDLASRAELAANRQRLNDLLSCVQLARGLAHFDAGDNNAAYECFRAMFDPGDPSFHQRERFNAVMFLAESAVRTGNQSDARSVVVALEAVALITPAPLLHAQLCFARAVLADEASAEPLFLAGLGLDTLSSWPWVRARLDQAYGEWLAKQNRPAQAKDHFLAARRVYVDTGADGWTRLLDRTVRQGRPRQATS